MGIRQFAGSLSDLNQDQLDAINAATTAISTAVVEVRTAVDEIKNVNLSAVLSKATDTYNAVLTSRQSNRYTRYRNNSNQPVTMNGWTSVFSAAGKGNLHVALSKGAGVSLRVTIDGVSKTWVNGTNNYPYGYAPLMPYANDNMYLMGMRYEYGENAMDNTLIEPVVAPLQFKNFCMIEILNTMSNMANVYFDVEVFY